MSVKNIVMSAAGVSTGTDPSFSTTSDPYSGSVIFNNTFNTSVNSQNTSWSSSATITTAPSGCPSAKALYITQGAGYLYSGQRFGNTGMVNLLSSFTLEWWFYVTSINTSYFSGRMLFLRADGGDPITIIMNSDKTIEFNNAISSANLWNLNTWNHVACVNNTSAGNKKLFLNGVNVATGSGNYGSNGGPAAWEWGDGHDFDCGYNAYVSNMRWTQAVRYTSNFTPAFVNFYGAAT